MENEYMKRGYLLPAGCKDLFDLVKHKQKPVPAVFLQSLPQHLSTIPDGPLKSWKQPDPLPPAKEQVFIPPHTTVRKLAALLNRKPLEIIGDLMKLGMFATADFLLDFKTISKVARMYGVTAIKAG